MIERPGASPSTKEEQMRMIKAFAVATALALSAAGAGAAEKDIEKIPSCQYCGMDRAKFAPTRLLIEYENGSVIGTCSIHCAAVDLAQSFTKAIRSIRVADYRTGSLTDAETAVWVVGAAVPGVMAAKSRVAFADRAAAEAFRKEKGGEIAGFDAAITSTYCDMWPDTKAIRGRRTKSGN
jgi:nitrous oxide reductase accessory protein NosL